METAFSIYRNLPKEERYKTVLPMIQGLAEEPDPVSMLANVAAALKEAFDFFWVGFYLVGGWEGGLQSAPSDGEGRLKSALQSALPELHLGPFQGPVACTRIGYGKGVCGTAWKEGRTLVVPDVEQFPGHIACSSLSRSEIVVPLMEEDRPASLSPATGLDRLVSLSSQVRGVLDVDSEHLAHFDEVDRRYLERLCAHLAPRLPR